MQIVRYSFTGNVDFLYRYLDVWRGDALFLNSRTTVVTHTDLYTSSLFRWGEINHWQAGLYVTRYTMYCSMRQLRRGNIKNDSDYKKELWFRCRHFATSWIIRNKYWPETFFMVSADLFNKRLPTGGSIWFQRADHSIKKIVRTFSLIPVYSLR